MLEFAKIPGLTKIFNRDDWMKVFLACSTLPDYRESKYSSYYITTDATIRSGKLYYEKNALDKGGYSYDPISHIALTNELDPTVPESEDYSFGPGNKHEFHEFILAAKYNGKRAVTEDIVFTQANTYYYGNVQSRTGYSPMTGGDSVVRGYDNTGKPIVYCHINSWQNWCVKVGDAREKRRFYAGWADSGLCDSYVYYRKSDGTFVKYGKIEWTSSESNDKHANFVRDHGDIWVLYTDSDVVAHFYQINDLVSEIGYTIYDSDIIGDQSISVSDNDYYFKKVVTSIAATSDKTFQDNKKYFICTTAPSIVGGLLELIKGTSDEVAAGDADYYVGMEIEEGSGVGDEYSERQLSFVNVDVDRGATITQTMLETKFNNYMYVARVAKVNNRVSVIADIATSLYTVDPTYGTLNHVTWLTNGYKISNAAFGAATDLKFRKTGTYYIKCPGTTYVEPGYAILDKSRYTIGRTISDWEEEQGIKVYTINTNFYVADTTFIGADTHGQAWYERAGTNYPYEGFVAVTTAASSNAAKGSLFQCKRMTYQLTEDAIHGYTGDGAEAVSKSYYQYDANTNLYTKAVPVYRNTEGSSFIQTTEDIYFLKNKNYYGDIMCTTLLRGGTKAQYEENPLYYDYYYDEAGEPAKGMRVDEYPKGKVYDRARTMYYRTYDALGRGTWQFNEIDPANRCGLTTDTKWTLTDPSSTTYKTYYFYTGTDYSFTIISADKHFSVVDDDLFGYETYNDTYYGYTKLIAGTDYTPGTTTAGSIEVEGWDNTKIYTENTVDHTLSDTPLAADAVLGTDVTVIYHIRNYKHVAEAKDASDMHASTYCYYDVTERKITSTLKNVPVADSLIKTYIGSTVYGEYEDGILNTYFVMSDPAAKTWDAKFSSFSLDFSPTNTTDTTVVAGKRYYQKNEVYTKSTDMKWYAYKTYYLKKEKEGVVRYERAGEMIQVASGVQWDAATVYWDKTGTALSSVWVKVDRYCTAKDTSWVTDRDYYKKEGDLYVLVRKEDFPDEIRYCSTEDEEWKQGKTYYKKVGSVYEEVSKTEYPTGSIPKSLGLYEETSPKALGLYLEAHKDVSPYDLRLYNQIYADMEGTPRSRDDVFELEADNYTRVIPEEGDNPKEKGWYEFTDSYLGRLINSQAKIIYRKGEKGTMPTECPICVNYKGEDAPAAEAGQQFRDGEELPSEPNLFVVSRNGESILPDEYYEECYGLYYWDQFFLDHGISCTPITNVRAVMTGSADDPGTLYLNWTDPTIMIKKDEPTATPDAWIKTTIELYDPSYDDESLTTKRKWTILVSTSCNAYNEVPATFDLSEKGLPDIAHQLDKSYENPPIRKSYVPSPYQRLKNGYLIITAISASGTQAVYHIKASDIVWTQTTEKRLVNLANGHFIEPGITDQPLDGVAIPGVTYIDVSTNQPATDVFERITPVTFNGETSKYKLIYSKDTPVIKVVLDADDGTIKSYTPIIVGETVAEGVDITFPDSESNAYLCTLASPKPEVTIQEIIKAGDGARFFDIGAEISIPDPSNIVGTKKDESTSASRATVIDFDGVRVNRDIEMYYDAPEHEHAVAGEKYYLRTATTNIETVEAEGVTGHYQYTEVPVPVGTQVQGLFYVQKDKPYLQFYTKKNQDPTMIGDAIFTAVKYNVSGWEAIVYDPSIPIYFRNPGLTRGGYFQYEDSTHSVSFRVTAPPESRAYDASYTQLNPSSTIVVAGKKYYAKCETSDEYLEFTTATNPEYFDGTGTEADPWKLKTNFSVTVEGKTYKNYYEFVSTADWRASTTRNFLNSHVYDKITSSTEQVEAGKTYYAKCDTNGKYLGFTTTSHPEYFDGAGTARNPWKFKTDFVHREGDTYTDYYYYELVDKVYIKIDTSTESVESGKVYYTKNTSKDEYVAFSTTTVPADTKVSEFFDGTGTTADPYKFKTNFSIVLGLAYKDYYKFIGYMGGSEASDKFFEAVRPVRNQVILRKIVTEGQYILTLDLYYRAGKTYYTRSGTGTEEDPYVYTAMTSVPVGELIPTNTIYELAQVPKDATVLSNTVSIDKFWLPSLNQIGVSSISSPDTEVYVGSFAPQVENSTLMAFDYNAYSRMKYKGAALINSTWWRLNPKIVPRTGDGQMYYTRTAIDYDTNKKTTISTSSENSYQVGFERYVGIILANGGQAACFSTDVDPKCYVYFTIA